MTKEELEKEATEYAQKLGAKDFIAKPKEIVAYFGYLAGAEPREKRIAELEKQHDIVRNERNLFQERCEDILENYYCDHKCKCAELEAEVKEWKAKADLWCNTANLKDHNIMINKELEKENAELKKLKRECETSLCRAEYQYNYEQLTKAKEIIREFVEWATWQGSNCPNFKSIQDKAEQFLSEVEK